jgi:hypothetical protein
MILLLMVFYDYAISCRLVKIDFRARKKSDPLCVKGG